MPQSPTCSHPECTCAVANAGAYCSEECKIAQPGSACPCPHPTCGGHGDVDPQTVAEKL
ncbi:MAG: hypothetical protein ACREUW_21505 [Burkholderiales bacterium]